MATLWTHKKKLAVYKKPAVESATLSFSVFSFFQNFDRNIIDTLRDIAELYMKPENVSKQIVVFHKVYFISHVNVGIIKILKLEKKLFQRPVFCKRLIYVTLTSNHYVAISAYSSNCKN